MFYGEAHSWEIRALKIHCSGVPTCDECEVMATNLKVEEIEVEVVPPESQTKGSDTSLTGLLAWILDDLVLIPGTKFRIGLDPLIGLVPGIGDTSAAALGSVILIRALQAGVPRIVIARMAVHLLLNALVGAIPGVGDVFSAWFKSNRRNHDLLKKHQGLGARRASTTGDWIFLLGMLGIVLAVTLGAALVAGYLAWRIFGFLFGWS